MIKFLKKFLKTETNQILLISICAILFFSINLTSWKFSFVGDEWPFFSFAKEIANHNFMINPFSFNGVFNEHRVLGSIWQAFFVKLFWFNNIFGWRFSNIILIIPINFFLYFLVKKLFSKKIAFFSIILSSSSFYIANFFKIGYLNPIALALFIIVLFYATKIGESFQIKDFVLLSFWLSLSFYVYIGPIFPLIIWPCLFLNHKLTLNKSLLLKIFVSVLIYSSLIFIGLLTSENNWFIVFHKTIIKREFSSNWQIITNILNNFLLFFRNSDYFYNHFVYGPYLDAISGILCFIGMITSVLKIKLKNYRLIIILFCLTCIVLGITNPYAYSPTTRGIFFLPFGFIFTAIGLDKISFFIKKYYLLILLSIFILNFFKSQFLIFAKIGYHKNSLIFKNLLEVNQENPKMPIEVISSDVDSYNYDDIFLLKRFSNIQNDLLISDYKSFSCLSSQNKTIIIFNDDYQTKSMLESNNCLKKYPLKIISEKYY